MKQKIKVRQIVFNRDPRKPDVLHVGLTDTKGRAWERYSDMPPGVWGEIVPPDEPESLSGRQRRRRDSKLKP